MEGESFSQCGSRSSAAGTRPEVCNWSTDGDQAVSKRGSRFGAARFMQLQCYTDEGRRFVQDGVLAGGLKIDDHKAKLVRQLHGWRALLFKVV